MKKRDSIWGSGPKLLGSTLAYLAFVLWIDKMFSQTFVIADEVLVIHFISGILIPTGLVIWIIAGRTIVKMYKSGSLYRAGLYSYCRHPLYANFILIVVPGVCLLANSWLVITTPVFMYVVFKQLIKVEEQGLVEQFGEAYIQYRKEVNAIVPQISK